MDCGTSLTTSLELIAKHYGVQQSHASILAGLPLEQGQLTPRLFVKAAQQMGFSAAIMPKQLAEITSDVLPIVLLLKNNQSCVLTAINASYAHILTASDTVTGEQLTLDILEEKYEGYAVYVKQENTFDSRTDEYESESKSSWFWDTIYQFKQQYVMIGFASMIISTLALATPLFVMNVYDRVIPNGAIATLWALGLGVTLAIMFDFLIKQLRLNLLEQTGKKIDNLLASQLMRKLLSVYGEYKPKSIGGFSNEISGYESIREFFTSATLVALFDFPFVFLFLWLVSFIGGALVYIPLVAIPLVIGVSIIFEIPMRKSMSDAHLASIQKHATLIESLIGIDQLKTLNAQGVMQRKWENNVGISAGATLKAKFFSSLIINFTTYIMQMVTIVTVIAGVYMIDGADGHEVTLTMGGLIACSILNSRSLAPLSQLASLVTRFQQARLGLNSLNLVMMRPTELQHSTSYIHKSHIKGDIEFDAVSFFYPEQKRAAVKNANFKINAGEKIGIIGRVGSGKSTVLKLILSLYHSNEGHIFIDGVDKEQLDVADIRNSIGYVSQEPQLFFGSLKDNLLIGSNQISDEEMIEVAKKVGVDEIARKNPNGYSMHIDERGENLSVGQRQLICIARALIKNPSILIMDEPTSAMDTHNEVGFLKMMASAVKDKTLILVTHKQSMLTLVNRLMVMDDSNIIIDGPKAGVLESIKSGKIKVRKHGK